MHASIACLLLYEDYVWVSLGNAMKATAKCAPTPPTVPCAGTVQYNILDAHDPHRFKISTDGPGRGWRLVQRMWVYPSV